MPPTITLPGLFLSHQPLSSSIVSDTHIFRPFYKLRFPIKYNPPNTHEIFNTLAAIYQLPHPAPSLDPGPILLRKHPEFNILLSPLLTS
jgi:hypothetical protein